MGAIPLWSHPLCEGNSPRCAVESRRFGVASSGLRAKGGRMARGSGMLAKGWPSCRTGNLEEKQLEIWGKETKTCDFSRETMGKPWVFYISASCLILRAWSTGNPDMLGIWIPIDGFMPSANMDDLPEVWLSQICIIYICVCMYIIYIYIICKIIYIYMCIICITIYIYIYIYICAQYIHIAVHDYEYGKAQNLKTLWAGFLSKIGLRKWSLHPSLRVAGEHQFAGWTPLCMTMVVTSQP